MDRQDQRAGVRHLAQELPPRRHSLRFASRSKKFEQLCVRAGTGSQEEVVPWTGQIRRIESNSCSVVLAKVHKDQDML
jgi:hypothetical protein